MGFTVIQFFLEFVHFVHGDVDSIRIHTSGRFGGCGNFFLDLTLHSLYVVASGRLGISISIFLVVVSFVFIVVVVSSLEFVGDSFLGFGDSLKLGRC